MEVLREFLQRFIEICPDADDEIDPADRRRIAKGEKDFERRIGDKGSKDLMPDLETQLKAVAETRQIASQVHYSRL